MPYRICRRFTVESGHMLSRHPESCRFPHGHTRTIEVVVEADELDASGMVLDFKALKLALSEHIDRYDHALAISSFDPLLPALREAYPAEALVEFEGDPTTEAMAKELFDFAALTLAQGRDHPQYPIAAARARLVRVRVWETPDSWAEYSA